MTMTHESLAYDEACAAIEAQAKRTAIAMIKWRARGYALRPCDLCGIAEDLSELPPRHLVTAIRYLTKVRDWGEKGGGQMRVAGRWFGFGGEVPAINLRAAMLYARYSRAKERQIARGEP